MSFYRLVPLFLLLASGQAAAQDQAYRVEVFGGAGGANIGGDEGSLGNGPCFVGGLGLRFGARASAELDLLRVQGGRREWYTSVKDVTGVFVDVIYHFSEGRTQAFVMGSMGRLDYSRSVSQPGDPAMVDRGDDNNFAWGAGAGVKVFLKPQLSLRPQLRMVFSEATGVMGLPAASVALGYHW